MQTCGKFQIVREFASGGDATIYTVADTSAATENELAIKVWRFPDEETTQAVRAAVEQHQAALSNGCRNFIPIIDHDVDETGCPFYVTHRYALSVDAMLRAKNAVGPEYLGRVVRGVLEALEDLAQKCSRPHGRITPGNVLLSSSDPAAVQVFLADMPAEVGRQTFQDDLYDLGRLIYQLIRRSEKVPNLNPPLEKADEWSVLGGEADSWLAFCNKLLLRQWDGALGASQALAECRTFSSSRGTAASRKRRILLGVAAIVTLITAGIFLWPSKQDTVPISEIRILTRYFAADPELESIFTGVIDAGRPVKLADLEHSLSSWGPYRRLEFAESEVGDLQEARKALGLARSLIPAGHKSSRSTSEEIRKRIELARSTVEAYDSFKEERNKLLRKADEVRRIRNAPVQPVVDATVRLPDSTDLEALSKSAQNANSQLERLRLFLLTDWATKIDRDRFAKEANPSPDSTPDQWMQEARKFATRSNDGRVQVWQRVLGEAEGRVSSIPAPSRGIVEGQITELAKLLQTPDTVNERRIVELVDALRQQEPGSGKLAEWRQAVNAVEPKLPRLADDDRKTAVSAIDEINSLLDQFNPGVEARLEQLLSTLQAFPTEIDSAKLAKYKGIAGATQEKLPKLMESDQRNARADIGVLQELLADPSRANEKQIEEIATRLVALKEDQYIAEKEEYKNLLAKLQGEINDSALTVENARSALDRFKVGIAAVPKLEQFPPVKTLLSDLDKLIAQQGTFSLDQLTQRGWKRGKEGQDYIVYSYGPFPVPFHRIQPRSGEPFAISAIEMPMAVALSKWQRPERRSPPTIGPQVWAALGKQTGLSSVWFGRAAQDTLASIQKYLDKVPLLAPDIAASSPETSTPMNYISGLEANEIATNLGGALPTSQQWQAAYELAQAQGWNSAPRVRGAGWKKQIDYLNKLASDLQKAMAAKGERQVANLDVGNGRRSLEADAGSYTSGTVTSDRLPSQNGPSDNVLWFMPVHRDSARAPEKIHDIVGNVAEFIQDGANIFAVGGSAVSAPSVAVNRPVSAPSPTGYSDVGFRIVVPIQGATAPSATLQDLRDRIANEMSGGLAVVQ